MIARVSAWDDGKLVMTIDEHSPSFDPAVIDHDNLADMIGKAVVRAINHSRTYELDLLHVEYRVRLEKD